MTAPVATYVFADDPILQAGVASQLRLRPEIDVLGPDEIDSAEVAVVVAESLDQEIACVLQAIQRGGVPRIVLVARVIDDAVLVAAAEAGVAGLLRRAEATPESLVGAVLKVASGGGEIPGDLLVRLLSQVGRLQRQVLAPRGLAFSGLSDRETQVLRMVADGYDTAAIANELCYSQRTVKNVLHDLTTRLHLKNRSHAVAYGVREGLI